MIDSHLLAYYIGIFIVFFSHIITLFTSKENMMVFHSVLNLVAGLCIAYYFLFKESYIKF